METSTIRIAIRGLNEPWDASRIPAVLDEIEASLREEADIPARLTADSMTIAIDVATGRLAEAASAPARTRADLTSGACPDSRRAEARLGVVVGRDGRGPAKETTHDPDPAVRRPSRHPLHRLRARGRDGVPRHHQPQGRRRRQRLQEPAQARAHRGGRRHRPRTRSGGTTRNAARSPCAPRRWPTAPSGSPRIRKDNRMASRRPHPRRSPPAAAPAPSRRR